VNVTERVPCPAAQLGVHIPHDAPRRWACSAEGVFGHHPTLAGAFRLRGAEGDLSRGCLGAAAMPSGVPQDMAPTPFPSLGKATRPGRG
jgi:hypothetical protein